MRKLITLLFLGSLLLQSGSAATSRPNIVVILTDDQGYADISLSPHHSKEVSTPHMDALAKDGVTFSQGYTSGHVCSPTRAGIMVGGYSQSVGVYTAGDGGRGFDPKKKIFPGYLPAEYVSSAIGKWHLGLDEDYPELKWHAMNRGFTECYKFMGRGGHSYFDLRSDSNAKFAHPIYRNKERINDEGYLTTRLTEEAVAFIDRNKKSPFFLYLAYNAVHAPAEAPEEDIKAYQKKFPGITKERAILMAMLKHLDDGVGAVTGKLKKEGLFDNTLLFFLTDNGGSKSMSADNTPLRGFKQTLDEGGIRTPFIVSWPDKFKGGRTIDTPIISFDILPTALDALNATPEENDFAGKSILPLLTGKTTKHHKELFWSKGPENEWAVRRGDWKLHWIKGKIELINLAKDLTEKKNLADANPAKVTELSKAYDAWIGTMAEPISGKPKRVDKSTPNTATATNKEMTPREIERARIRATKKAAKNKKKAEEKKQSTPSKPTTGAKSPIELKSSTPPSEHFNLSHWKLTLPTNEKMKYEGHPKEIASKTLNHGFMDAHFYTTEGNAMTFWCPVNGATTEGTEYPRCELREMLSPGNPRHNWTMSGTHTLEARCKVIQVPSYPKVVIGQIHSYSGKAKPLVKLQYYKGRIEALVKQSPNKGKDKKLTFEYVDLNTDIQWRIELKDGTLSIKVNETTLSENMIQHDESWADQTFYFKAGVYPQENDGDSSEGARVSFSHLKVAHSD